MCDGPSARMTGSENTSLSLSSVPTSPPTLVALVTNDGSQMRRRQHQQQQPVMLLLLLDDEESSAGTCVTKRTRYTQNIVQISHFV